MDDNYGTLLRTIEIKEYHSLIDVLLKFLIIGESNCGKSCILNRFLNGSFKQNFTHTIGVEFASKLVRIGKHVVKLQIWDTAGQERFRSVTRSYYRGATGALLVYDVTNRRSFEALNTWLNDARKLASDDIVIVMVGNKADLENQRQVSYTEAARLANEHDLIYVETSALTGVGIEDIFHRCTTAILASIETGRIDPEAMGAGIQFGTSNSASSFTRFELSNRGATPGAIRSKCC